MITEENKKKILDVVSALQEDVVAWTWKDDEFALIYHYNPDPMWTGEFQYSSLTRNVMEGIEGFLEDSGMKGQEITYKKNQ